MANINANVSHHSDPGQWLQLRGVSLNSLPRNLKLEKVTINDSPTPTISPHGTVKGFLQDVIGSSSRFIDSVAPKDGGDSTWKRCGSLLSRMPNVRFFKRSVLSELDPAAQDGGRVQQKKEVWYCRRSVHTASDKIGDGASWEEFTRRLKQHHADTEFLSTPNVQGAREVEPLGAFNQGRDFIVDVDGAQWNDVTMVIMEMDHKVMKGMKVRRFPVLLITASLQKPGRSGASKEFLVISIPINDLYGNDPEDLNVVLASYAAVERIRILPIDHPTPGDGGKIEWIMATTVRGLCGECVVLYNLLTGTQSDAKITWIPQKIQNLFIPGAIGKDVPLVLDYIRRNRAQ